MKRKPEVTPKDIQRAGKEKRIQEFDTLIKHVFPDPKKPEEVAYAQQSEISPLLPTPQIEQEEQKRGLKHIIEQIWGRATPVNEHFLAEGAGTNVYSVEREGKKPLVIKVERAFRDPDDPNGELFVPATTFGGDEGKVTITDDGSLNLVSLKEREAQHQEVRQQLEDHGIQTARYIGGVVVGGFEKGEKAHIIRNTTRLIPSKKEVRGEIPLWAEVWEHPGGELMGTNEKRVEELYASEEGRAELERFARSLLEISREGYSLDLTNPDMATNKFIPLRTKRKSLPFPRNMMLTENNQIVAIDFNDGCDLTELNLWSPEDFPNAEDLLYRSYEDNRLYDNHRIFEQGLIERVRQQMKEELSSISQRAGTENPDLLTEEYARRFKFWNNVENEAARLGAQVNLAAQIFNELEKRTGQLYSDVTAPERPPAESRATKRLQPTFEEDF